MTWADEHGVAARLSRNETAADRLPLILCGPILRRTEPDSVTVWVALKKAQTVTLRVYSHAPPPAEESLREELQGTRRTVQLGDHLHVVAITARPVAADRPLAPGTVYFYNLFFSSSDVLPVPETEEHLNSPNVFELEESLSLDSLQPSALSYSIEHKLPSFSLPPEDLNKLRIIHGSCRQPHGTGRDAMSALDEIINLDFAVADERPHLLLLTGDQIYADDVAHSLLFMLMDADKALLGWSETLPGVTQQEEETLLLPSKREPIVRKRAGFTTEDPKSQLLRLGEYYAMYLFTWSDVLWPTQFPGFDDVKNDSLKRKTYDRERTRLLEFRKAIREVRRALANVPSYMIVDDHDVTDDWNMLRDWCETIYTRPLSRRIIQNALLAYAIFQGWGNTPDRFAPGQPGDVLLTAAAAWVEAEGKDPNLKRQIERLAGIPGTLSDDGQLTTPMFMEVQGFTQLAVNEALRWHYTIKGPKFEILVLDSRTQRAFTADKYAPPAHLGPGALDEQLPLDNVDPNKLIIVVSTTNVFTTPSFHGAKVFGESFILKWWYMAFRLGVDILLPFLQFLGVAPKFTHYNPDLNESWVPQSPAFESLLSRLSRRTALTTGEGTRRARVLLLTGDVHFSWASRMQYWGDHPLDAAPSAEPVEAIFAQLASSPFLKQEGFAEKFHIWGYIPMTDSLPGAIRWFGWKDRNSLLFNWQDLGPQADWEKMGERLERSDPPMLSLIDAPSAASALPPPDWRYRLDFMLGEKSGNDLTLNMLEKPNSSDRDAWFEVLGEAQRRHRDYAQKFGDGLELVGKNSLGELRLQWEGSTTLISAVGATDTSFRVAAPALLPAPPLLIKIDGEIIKVGDLHRGTGVCSKVARGQRGTTAASHLANAAVTVFKTATQTQWWRLTEQTTLQPLTRYTLSLSYVDPQFPKPKVPGEANS